MCVFNITQQLIQIYPNKQKTNFKTMKGKKYMPLIIVKTRSYRIPKILNK